MEAFDGQAESVSLCIRETPTEFVNEIDELVGVSLGVSKMLHASTISFIQTVSWQPLRPLAAASWAPRDKLPSV